MARKALAIFAEKMEKRLQEKDGEYGESGWHDEKCTVRFFFYTIGPLKNYLKHGLI